MKFLIQTINNKIEHDFSFTLLKAIEYQQWLKNDIEYKLVNKGLEPGYIPIGSVEFVMNYLLINHKKFPCPKNIPKELRIDKFTKRKVWNVNSYDLVNDGNEYVIKSADIIKRYFNNTKNLEDVPKGRYFISELIDIDSEYRCFVFKNKLVGLQHYSGDFTIFPDINTINEIIETYKPTSPVSYTLDVGINKDGTFIIEVHDFFSCGLYGFADLNLLPYMFSQWFYEFINK